MASSTAGGLRAVNAPALVRALACTLAVVRGAWASSDLNDIVQDMSLDDKIGQMTQINVDLVLGDNHTVDTNKLRHWLGTYRVGSILNSPYASKLCEPGGKSGWTAQEFRTFARTVQTEARRQGLQPVILGLDSVHGANYVKGATIFGQQITLAATFDRHLVERVGKVTARDTVAAGVPWLFAPILGIATSPTWPRVYETFGEDPFVAAELGVAIIRGMQADTGDGEMPRAAACMKHYFAYSHPDSGHDRAPVYVPEAVLRDHYLPPFRAAVQDAKVASAMNSYNELNGVPIAASRKYLRELLRDELRFEGMLVTDWGEINNLHSFHHAARSYEAAVHVALNRTSIDMSMVPLDDSFPKHLKALVRAGAIPESRLDESVKRILALKKFVGLLSAPVLSDRSPLLAQVGSDADLAIEAARASVTLLVNRGLNRDAGKRRACGSILWNGTATDGFDLQSLPKAEAASAEMCRDACALHPACVVWLYKGSWEWDACFLKGPGATAEQAGGGPGDAAGACDPPRTTPPVLPLVVAGDGHVSRVLLTGPTANSLVYQAGGWSVHWQGACSDTDFAGGETLRGALERLLPASVSLVHTQGCTINAPSHASAKCETDPTDLAATVGEQGARAADVAIIALGEESYTEKPGDIDNLNLHDGQVDLVHAVAESAPALPIILVLIEGRPRLLRDLLNIPSVVAVVHAYLPGPHGGTAIAEALLGQTNPSGRLPLTYPSQPHAFRTHYHVFSHQCAGSEPAFLSTGTTDCPVEFPFGRGLSFTSFEYSDMQATPGDQVVHPVRCTVMRARATQRAGPRVPPVVPSRLSAGRAFAPAILTPGDLPGCAMHQPAAALLAWVLQASFGVSVLVTNSGTRHGRHTVLLFYTQAYRAGVAPEVQRLVGFDNVRLDAGDSKTIMFQVSTDQLAYTAEDMSTIVESGTYHFFCTNGTAVESKLDITVTVAAATTTSARVARMVEATTTAVATPIQRMDPVAFAFTVAGSALGCCLFGAGLVGCVAVMRRQRAGYGQLQLQGSTRSMSQLTAIDPPTATQGGVEPSPLRRDSDAVGMPAGDSAETEMNHLHLRT